MTDENEPFTNLPLDKIEMLSQPLTTEEGFLNPACVNELEAAIRNMPALRADLREDTEWTIAQCTCLSDIVRHFAGFAISLMLDPPNADGLYPPRVSEVVQFLNASLRRWKMADFHGVWMGDISLCELHDWLWEVLKDLDAFKAWNDVDRVGPAWIDLHALITNVCVSIRKDRRHSYAFDLKFEREHGPLEAEDYDFGGR